MRFGRRKRPWTPTDISAAGSIDPSKLRFSLPTICDELPPTGNSVDAAAFLIHEDDWRQIELVGVGELEAVRRNFEAVRQVKRESPGFGFGRIHVGEEPRSPLTDVDVERNRIDALLATTGARLTTMGFFESAAEIRGAFAYVGDATTLYGVEVSGRVEIIGVQPTSQAKEVDPVRDAAFDLATELGGWLVDWSATRTFPLMDEPER